MFRLRLLLGSFLNVPDQESPFCWKLSKGNLHRAEQPRRPRSGRRSSEQKACPVGNKNELPNFRKADVKVSAAEQKSSQEDVHRLARGSSKRKVRFGFGGFFFPSIGYSSQRNALPVTSLHTSRVTRYHLSRCLLQP